MTLSSEEEQSERQKLRTTNKCEFNLTVRVGSFFILKQIDTDTGSFMAISYSNCTQASPTHTGHEGVDVVEAEGERAGHELAEGGAGLLDHEFQDPQELLDRPAR